jgi:hypothetical protein
MAYGPKLSWKGVAGMMNGLCGTTQPGTSVHMGNGSMLRIYDNTGAVPTECDDAANINGAVLLAELTLASTPFGTCVDTTGVITAAAITPDSSANATGTAAFARYFAADGTTALFQGLCGTSASDFILNSLSIQIGANVSCTNYATLTGARH